MQYEEDRLKQQKEREKGNLIYREVIHLDKSKKTSQAATKAEDKGSLVQIKDSIMHKISEGVEAVKEMIHDVTAPAELESSHKLPKPQAKIVEGLKSEFHASTPANYVAFSRPRSHRGTIRAAQESAEGALLNPEGGHRQAMIREKKSPHKHLTMEEFMEEARSHRQAA